MIASLRACQNTGVFYRFSMGCLRGVSARFPENTRSQKRTLNPLVVSSSLTWPTKIPLTLSPQSLRIPACAEATPVKTHDSFDPAGSSRTGDGRESTAATNLPQTLADSECPVAAYPAGNSHEQFTPAAKAECTPLRAGRRLATENRHSWVKQVSPQSACMP
jgi:hypothetical protein